MVRVNAANNHFSRSLGSPELWGRETEGLEVVSKAHAPHPPATPLLLFPAHIQAWDMDNLVADNAGRSQSQLLHPHNKSPSTAVAAAPQEEACEEGGAGVLLYYKYVDLGEAWRSAVKDWYLHHCGVEGLRGR